MNNQIFQRALFAWASQSNHPNIGVGWCRLRPVYRLFHINDHPVQLEITINADSVDTELMTTSAGGHPDWPINLGQVLRSSPGLTYFNTLDSVADLIKLLDWTAAQVPLPELTDDEVAEFIPIALRQGFVGIIRWPHGTGTYDLVRRFPDNTHGEAGIHFTHPNIADYFRQAVDGAAPGEIRRQMAWIESKDALGYFDPVPWMHRNGNFYFIEDDNVIIEETVTPSVSYRSADTGMSWVRSREKFYDGRFNQG